MATQTVSRNYYEILHVSVDAPLEIIRGSYRTLMQQLRHHPDLGGDTATAALINEAYAVLSDTESRADYDALLLVMGGVAQGVAEEQTAAAGPVNASQVLDPARECVFCESPHELGKIIELDPGCSECGSPLCTAENQRMESAGQRAVERITKQQDLRFFTHWPQRGGFVGRTEDISPNGLRLVTKTQLVEGQRLKIVSEVLDAVGYVTHCVSKRKGWSASCVAGVSFVTLRFARSVGGFVSDHV